MMIVYLLDNNVNAINSALSKTLKGHVFYENKDILHKLIHIPIIERVKSQFFQKICSKNWQ